ncbi:MAG: tetratricopeptide repeat protein [Candidatus Woesearchaeota archaeon]
MPPQSLDLIIEESNLQIPYWHRQWLKGFSHSPDIEQVRPPLTYRINSHDDFLGMLDMHTRPASSSLKSFNTRNIELVKERHHQQIYDNCREAIRNKREFDGCYENLCIAAIHLETYKEALVFLENYSRKHPLSKTIYQDMGYILLKEGRTKKAIATYKKGLKDFPDEQLQKNYAYALLFDNKQQSFRYTFENGMIDADMLFALFRHKDIRYWDFIHNCKELSFTNKPDLKAAAHCLHGVDSFQRLLDKNHGKRYRKRKVDNFDNTKKDYLKQMVKSIRQDPSQLQNTSIYKRATCTLYAFEDPLLHDTIVIKAWKRSFEEEISLTHKLMEILGKEVILPHPLGQFSDDKMNYYAMQMQEGETFTEKILKNSLTPELYEQGLSVLAKIYSKMPKQEFDHSYLQARIEEQVEGMEVKPYLKDVIYAILGQHDFYESTHVFCKDAHSDNFGEKNGKIIIYDTEDKKVVPLSFDISHYLFCIPFYKDHNKRKELIHRNFHQFSSIRGENLQSPKEYEKEVLDVALYRCATKWQYYMERDRPTEASLVLQAGIETAKHLEGKPYRSYVRGFTKYMNSLQKL